MRARVSGVMWLIFLSFKQKSDTNASQLPKYKGSNRKYSDTKRAGASQLSITHIEGDGNTKLNED